MILDTIRKLLRKYRDVLVYLIFGVLTTVVNYLVYFPCYYLLGWKAVVSNLVAWAAAVLFAYVTNKPFVFRSHDWSAKTVIPELAKFVGTRVASGGLESAIIWFTVDLLGFSSLVWKLLTSVLVVILNYIGSKLLVFRGK